MNKVEAGQFLRCRMGNCGWSSPKFGSFEVVSNEVDVESGKLKVDCGGYYVEAIYTVGGSTANCVVDGIDYLFTIG